MSSADQGYGPLAERVRVALEKTGMTQIAFEKAARMPKGYASRILAGQRRSLRPDLVHRMAKVLGVDYEWLSVGASPGPEHLDLEIEPDHHGGIMAEPRELVDVLAVKFKGFAKAVNAARAIDLSDAAIVLCARDLALIEEDQRPTWWLDQIRARHEYLQVPRRARRRDPESDRRSEDVGGDTPE